MYYTNVSVGTPAVQYTVIVDTGSSDFLIPNASCETCAGDPSTFYDVSASATGQIVRCNDVRYKCSLCSLDGQCIFDTSYVGITENSAVPSSLPSTVGGAHVIRVVDEGYCCDPQLTNGCLNRLWSDSQHHHAQHRHQGSAHAPRRCPERLLPRGST